MIKGVIVSIGSHPAATICSPVTLEDNIGTLSLKTNTHPVVVLNMKEIDSLNFVKLDLLGLANVEIINKTCDLIGMKRITADRIDYNNDAVWQDIMKHPIGIFQFESDFAHSYLKDIFRPEVLEKIKEKNPKLNYLDLMSMANGAIRPAGKSYRAALSNGEFNDNGHEALNNFLASTNGFLVYQEQIIEFLYSFCGFSMGKADIVRRGFAKKTGTEQFIPDIKAGFIGTMKEKYDVLEERSEELIIQFLKVIEDASSYLFSYNHALPYSMIGYATAWLRYYYPLEFLTTLLEMNKDDQEKTSDVLDFIRQFTTIKVKPIRFRYSTSEYNIDKTTNMIYKGMQSIKYLSEKISSELYELRKNQYNDFIELLIDLKEKTSCDSRQTKILIKLDFFSEFGKNKRLLDIYTLFELIYGKTQLKKEKAIELGFDLELIDKLSRATAKTYMDFQSEEFLKETIKTISDECISLSDQLITEIEYLGRAIGRYSVPEDYMIVCDMELKSTKKNNKKYATIHLYGLKDGNMITANVWGTQLYSGVDIDNLEPIQLLHTYDIICANLKHDENGWCDTLKSFVMLQKYNPEGNNDKEEILQ
jgi:DNA polymerase-3 subunit alpha